MKTIQFKKYTQKIQKSITQIVAFSFLVMLFSVVMSPVLAGAANNPGSLQAGSPSNNPAGLSGGGVSTSQGGNAGKFSNPLGDNNAKLSGFLEKILNVVVQLGAIVVVFFYIYAGFKFVIVRGNEGEIKKAIEMLTWTTVGALVILGAQVISHAIQGTVTQISSGK